ncbi:MAG: hypothetical protein OEM02_02070 [Desulfobulbaceae bacterium]|nr:hypothetical protein [Desulfobulbaceae bacterium]
MKIQRMDCKKERIAHSLWFSPDALGRAHSLLPATGTARRPLRSLSLAH